MKRRAFMTPLGSAIVTWPIASHAQQPERVPRIGVLMSAAQDDPEGQARVAAFWEGLHKLGWTDGRNVRVDIRWAAGNPALDRKFAAE
jgi:putative ABC transport system substrate-binding protein